MIVLVSGSHYNHHQILCMFSTELGSDFQMPCILFTGHPSLRMGDAVHFIEAWGKNAANTVIFTGNFLKKKFHKVIHFFSFLHIKGVTSKYDL